MARSFTGHRRGDDLPPAPAVEKKYPWNPTSTKLKWIPSSATPRPGSPWPPFLALFTTGAALPFWRGPSSDPEGFHWIDPAMSAVKTLSTVAAILPIPHLVFAARVYAERQEEQLRLRFQHGLAEGWKQAAQRVSEGSTDVWTDRTEGRSWLKPPAWKAGQNPSLRPGPETPGVDAVPSLRDLNSMTTRNHRPIHFGGRT